MPRRSQSTTDALLTAPWWVSAGIGAILAIVVYVLLQNISEAGQFGRAAAHSLRWTPILVFCVFATAALMSAFFGKRRKEWIRQAERIEGLRALSWSAFEFMVAEAFRRQGYGVDQPLAGGSDGGVDLTLKKDGMSTIVQCKHWKTQSVGVPIIQQIFGILKHEHADAAIVICTGHFSREAAEFARGKPITLIDGETLVAMIGGAPSNQPPSATIKSVAPTCPTCGGPMTRKTARRGPNAGTQFWGCVAYPNCKGARNS